MRHILLLRHAKSSRDDPGLRDFDRPLADRGLRDAPAMGKFLREIDYRPQAIISSPAQRARQTTELFAEAAGLDMNIITWNKDMYYGSARDYLKAIQQIPDETGCALLIGHNPLMEDTVSILCSKENKPVVIMPTAALVCLEHRAGGWHQIQPGTARIKWMMIPRLLNLMIY